MTRTAQMRDGWLEVAIGPVYARGKFWCVVAAVHLGTTPVNGPDPTEVRDHEIVPDPGDDPIDFDTWLADAGEDAQPLLEAIDEQLVAKARRIAGR